VKAQTTAGDDRERKLKANQDLQKYTTDLAAGEVKKRESFGNLLYEDQTKPSEQHGLKAHVKELSFSGFERNPVFYNVGGKFVDIGGALGAALLDDGRAAVAADFDGDGDDDIVVHNVYVPHVVAFRNDIAREAQLVVRLRGVKTNRFGIGARVVVTAGTLKRAEEIRCGSGYLSAGPPEAHFGLAGNLATVEVRWPTGELQKVEGVGPGILVFQEGGPISTSGAVQVKAPPVPVVARLLRSGDVFSVAASYGGETFANRFDKPTIVHVWSVRCFSCREEVLRCREIVEAARAAGFGYVSVNIDGKPESFAKYAPPGGWPVPIWMLKGTTEALLPAVEPTLPAHFIVGTDGMILDRMVGSLEPKELVEAARKAAGK